MEQGQWKYATINSGDGFTQFRSVNTPSSQLSFPKLSPFTQIQVTNCIAVPKSRIISLTSFIHTLSPIVRLLDDTQMLFDDLMTLHYFGWREATREERDLGKSQFSDLDASLPHQFSEKTERQGEPPVYVRDMPVQFLKISASVEETFANLVHIDLNFTNVNGRILSADRYDYTGIPRDKA